jgi:tRNA pseudouridine32 synthase/23S rRNA pseudouridine746 synthase
LENLPHLDPESWERRSWLGGIYVNGRKFALENQIPNPCKIEYFEPKYDVFNPQDAFPRFDKSWIFYADDDLIGVFKPAGLPTLPTREQQHFCLKYYVQKHLGFSPHLPSRLDAATAGVVPMSISKRMHSRLQRMFERRLVKKTYRFLSHYEAESECGIIDLPIARDPVHPILRKIDFENGKSARTRFSLLELREKALLYEAQPITGRTHQIRLHALALGCPLVGDPFYSLDERNKTEQDLCLSCVELRLYQPFLMTPVALRAPEKLLPSWARTRDH